MSDLIKQLEEAEEGSVKLDECVLLAIGWRREWQDWFPPGEENRLVSQGALPQPTRSIDAALALVPDAWQGIWVGEEWTGPHKTPERTKGIASLRRGLHSYVVAEAEAKTPALALCIAALRARETE